MLSEIKTVTRRLDVVLRWIILFVFIDQLTKKLAVDYLSTQSFPLIPNFLSFTLVYNKGMAFGLLANARFLFLAVSVVALIIGWKYYKLYFTKSVWFYWAGILFFAGTLGNFLDRLFYGQVTDFIAVHFGSYPFPIFNMADSFLCISVMIILAAVLLEEKQGKDEA